MPAPLHAAQWRAVTGKVYGSAKLLARGCLGGLSYIAVGATRSPGRTATEAGRAKAHQMLVCHDVQVLSSLVLAYAAPLLVGHGCVALDVLSKICYVFTW